MSSPVSFASKPAGERVLLRPVEVADAAGLLAVDAETLRLPPGWAVHHGHPALPR
jgi:hypothetical protein